MKKFSFLLVAFLLMQQAANALIVSVNGFGEIPEEGLELTVNEAEVDPMTDLPTMEVKGELMASGSLNVTITRSSEGLEDEFCCAGACKSGNGEKNEQLNYTPSGNVSWYVHYRPAVQSKETIEYVFEDDEDRLVLTVHFVNGVEEPIVFPKKHLIEEFTGQDCGYCPYGMDCISEFMSNDTNWVLILHHYGYMADHFSVSGSKTITNKLSVSGAPSAAINRAKTRTEGGNAIVFHPGYLPTADKSQFETTTYASINLQNSYNEEDRALNVHVSGLIADTSKHNLMLTVLVKESGMIDYQADYYNSFEGWKEFRHCNAVRAFLTASTGDAITIDSTQHYSMDLSVAMDAKWVAENCMVVAFLSEAFKPIVQAEQRPVVEGTQGGADIAHGGVTANPVADYYPEPSGGKGPVNYSKLATDTLNSAYAYYEEESNRWSIQAYNLTEKIRINGAYNIPFVWMYLYVDPEMKELPYGTFEFTSTQEAGTAWAGFRDDEHQVIDGSIFYYTSLSYFKQGYLSPAAEWLITEGRLVISETGWSVQGTSLNGSTISLLGTTPIDYDGKPQGVETLEEDKGKVTKILQGQQILIQRGDKTYTITGSTVQF